MGRVFVCLSFSTLTIGMQYSTVDICDIRGGWFAVEQGNPQGWVLAPLLFNIFFAAFMNVTYTRFKAEKTCMDALVHLRNRTGAAGRGGATDGEPALVTWL